MQKKQWLVVLAFILVVEAVGLLSSMLSGNIGQKYAELVLPPLSPPGWLFGIVWPILFALMGVAIYLIYRSNAAGTGKAALWFWVQLAMNFIWPIIFFGAGLLWAAVAIILLLDVLVAYTIALFRPINRTAAALLVPYFIWLLFATYLNLGVALLN